MTEIDDRDGDDNTRSFKLQSRWDTTILFVFVMDRYGIRVTVAMLYIVDI